MSVLKKIFGDEHSNPEDFPQAQLENNQQTEQQAEHTIQTVEVSGSKDIMTVKDHLHENNVVFIEISSQSQISAEHIVEDIKKSVEQLGGDIAWRTDSEVIVAPNGFYISRERE